MIATTHPLASSARATTAYESRFRIDYPLVPARAPQVVALDPGAAAIVERAAAMPWDTASFYSSAPADAGPDLALQRVGGGEVPLARVIDDVDAVILVATDDSGASVAWRIAEASWAKSIMVAGLVFGTGDPRHTVASLRPFARILLVSYDESDLEALLVAIRA
jgi:hypothetical protein